ncbi:MAG: alpha/beta hydrolase [Desulfobacteraceae bacterium]|nr:lysophospholipase [Desulfobacteraceae bacterium]MBC2757112.1 alpha/beta hydrolase [Desulfobacteraceae bacterium]
MTNTSEITDNFSVDDGLSIFYRHRPADNETARMVIAHGLGEHSGRYSHIIDRLVSMGISVWALDHRGHGQSGGKRGHIDSIDQYINDLKKMIDIAKTDMPGGTKFFLLGHSMGGLIVLNFVERDTNIADGVIASSPGLNPGMKVPVIKGAVAKILSRIWPSLTFDNELDSSALSHDKHVVKAYDNDPLVHRNITARWFTEFFNAMENTKLSASNINIPVLMQVAGDDRLVDAETSRQFFESLTLKDKTLFFYDSLYHEIYNEQTGDRKKVLNDLVNWLSDHI